MFRRSPGLPGYGGGRLGLREFQTEISATELIHRREIDGAMDEDVPGPAEALRQAFSPVGRPRRLVRR